MIQENKRLPTMSGALISTYLFTFLTYLLALLLLLFRAGGLGLRAEAGTAAGATSTAIIDGAGAFERITAQVNTPSKTSATAQTPREAPPEYCTMMGAIITDTRFTTLIIGFSAGPAVSLNGSPTVSPTTPALWRSEPLPRFLAGSFGSSSISFLALSQAPPELLRNTASN